MFNQDDFELLLGKYPLLERILLGGILTKKLLRTLLGIDKWEADTLHGNLRMCGAIYITSAVLFRATDECIAYLEQRKK